MPGPGLHLQVPSAVSSPLRMASGSLASSFSPPCRSWGRTQSRQASASLKVHWERRAETWPGPLHSSPHALAACEPLLLYIPQPWVLARLILLPGALPQGFNPATGFQIARLLLPGVAKCQVCIATLARAPSAHFLLLLSPLTPCSFREQPHRFCPREPCICWKSRGWWAPQRAWWSPRCPPTSEARLMGTQV